MHLSALFYDEVTAKALTPKIRSGISNSKVSISFKDTALIRAPIKSCWINLALAATELRLPVSCASNCFNIDSIRDLPISNTLECCLAVEVETVAW